MSQTQPQPQPLPRLPLTGEELEPNLASTSVNQVISGEVCLSPSLESLPLSRGGREGLGRAGEGFVFDSAFLPYTKNLPALARENRSNPTKAETRIWQDVLRMRPFAHYKFLRQKPIGGYIVDFYCSELRLVIEVDGASHAETVAYDLERTRFLNALGLQVIRYTNDEILRNIDGVYEDLNQRIGRDS